MNISNEENKYQFYVPSSCPMCRKNHEMGLTDEEYEKYYIYTLGVGHIQDALPKLNPMEREFLMTGYCPICQELLFGSNHKSDRFKEIN